MGKNTVLRLLALSLLATATGCPEEKQANQASVVVKVEPKELTPDGAEAEVTIKAYNADNTPGVGNVTVSAAAGLIDGENEVELTLEGGEATTTFSCDVELDADCAGKVRITAVWNGISGRTNVELPGGDAGVATGDGMVSGDFSIAMTRSRPSVYLGIDNASELEVTLLLSNNLPAKTQAVKFTTTLGTLVSEAAEGATITETTDNNGRIKVSLVGGEEAGTATITAEHIFSGAKATTTVGIKSLQQITYTGTKCDGKTCTIMGKNGSGFNELAVMSFKVTEAGGKGAEGVPVTFSLSDNYPGGTTVAEEGMTDASGVVTTMVAAGNAIGTFNVTATVIPVTVTATSTTIGVRGAKPSNQGFDFSCNTVNTPAYVSNTPPAPYDITCTFRLVDTTNNPVGTGTPVYFKAEAGSIPNSVASTAFSTTGGNPNEGRGSVTFSTQGTWPPSETEPFAADPAQYPMAREAEPSYLDGSITRNPRDGVITIIAYVRGEEYYDDNNSDGSWDVGERFYDMGEAFVDSNDNNVWDLGEILVDDAPANGVWDAPNGVWDSSTTIWSEAKIVATGRAAAGLASVEGNPGFGDCGSGLGKTEVAYLSGYLPDLNLNRLFAGSTFSFTETFTKGTFVIHSNNLGLDGYGFDIEWLWVDSMTGLACTPASDACVRKSALGSWSAGYAGIVKATGTALTDMTACAQGTVSIKSTTLGVTTTVDYNGGIE